MKRSTGRPTKYWPKFCDTIIAVAQKGGWLAQMATECGVHRSTIDEWAAAHPEFSEALSRARTISQAAMEAEARASLSNREYNAGLWKHLMAARHPEYRVQRIGHKDLEERPVTFKVTIPGLKGDAGLNDL